MKAAFATISFAVLVSVVVNAKTLSRLQPPVQPDDDYAWLDHSDDYEVDYIDDDLDEDDYFADKSDPLLIIDDTDDWMVDEYPSDFRKKRSIEQKWNLRQQNGGKWVEKFCSGEQPDQVPPKLQKKLNKMTEEQKQQFMERRQKMQQCCDLDDEADKAECFKNISLSKFTKVCSGEEQLILRKPIQNLEEIKTKCCAPAEAEIIDKCFKTEVHTQYKEAKKEKCKSRPHGCGKKGKKGNACCLAGQAYDTGLDGESSIAACQTGADNFDVPPGTRPWMCKKIFTKCCLKSAGLFGVQS